MNIFKVEEIDLLKKETAGKKVVLAGGCFDVLHPGHIVFLESAKKEGDLLVVLLESDLKIKELKGEDRPFFTQVDRAKVLSSVRFVDFIVLMTYSNNESDYDEVVLKINPSVIAATKGGVDEAFKKRSAEKAGADLRFVTEVIGDYSTSQILKFGRGQA